MKKLTTLLILFALLAIPMTAMAKGTGNTWHVPDDFGTIQEAIDSSLVANFDTIKVGPGSHAGAYVSKPVKIIGQGKAVIDSGPMHPTGVSQGFRLLAGSDGTVISRLQFEVDMPISEPYAAAVSDVTVTQNTFINAGQAICCSSGSGWTISYNDIIDLQTGDDGTAGIGIVILVGGDQRTVSDNVISHNNITGTLHVGPNAVGGEEAEAAGIVLAAYYHKGYGVIKNNLVTHNKVSLVSDNPDVVDVPAFKMWDLRDDTSTGPVIFDNIIKFNDFRGTALQIVLDPPELADYNDISQNK